MDTRSLAQPSTGELRGLQLYKDHADDIRFEDSVWLVPSQHDAASVYEVVLGCSESGETCQCADFEHRSVRCLHTYAATIARAKRASCAGCGGRFLHGDLIEITEGHESLTFFEGHKLCRRDCATGHGVL